MLQTVKANENNDLKYLQGLMSEGSIPGGRTMPTINCIPLNENKEEEEEIQYITE